MEPDETPEAVIVPNRAMRRAARRRVKTPTLRAFQRTFRGVHTLQDVVILAKVARVVREGER